MAHIFSISTEFGLHLLCLVLQKMRVYLSQRSTDTGVIVELRFKCSSRIDFLIGGLDFLFSFAL